MNHLWGDTDFDWDALYEAGGYISLSVRRYTGCTLIWKEKYGTLRYEFLIAPYGTLCYYQFKGQRWWMSTVVYRMWVRLGWRVAEFFMCRACKLWPHIAEEISADWEGGW